MNSKYKVLALDLDGTLTNAQHKISPATRNALIGLQREGVILVLASGRTTFGIEGVARELKMDEWGGYILSYNGAKIISCRDKEILARKTIDLKLIPRIYDIADRCGLVALSYTSQEIITEDANAPIVQYESKVNNHMPIREVTDLVGALTRAPFKMVIGGDTNDVLRARGLLEMELGEELSLFTGNPEFIEIASADVYKGGALQFLLSDLGLTPEQLIAVGDTHNDLSMIQMAGLGVAMANATEAVKQCADYITKSNDEEGITHLLNKIFFEPDSRPEADIKAINALAKNTLMESLGIVCTRLEEGYVEATMPVDVRTRQPMGILHGGASLALAETLAGYGSVYLLKENEIQVGMQVSGNHISTAHEGEVLKAEAVMIHCGRSTHVWNVDIYTTARKRIASVRVLNSIIKRR